jgi:hypothetical protein
LRQLALTRLKAAKNDAVRQIHQRSQFYRLGNSAATFRLRTNRKGILILETGAPDAEAKLFIEDADYLLFACVLEDVVAVYWIPIPIVASHARHDHAEWLKTATTGDHNRTWQMIFDYNQNAPCRGYATKFAAYLL